MPVRLADMINGVPLPPKSGAQSAERKPGRSPYSMSEAELSQLFMGLLKGANRLASLGSVGTDGTPTIKSIVSVWLISQVGGLIGRPRLVNLAKVDREHLRSLGGLVRLVHQALSSTHGESTEVI